MRSIFIFAKYALKWELKTFCTVVLATILLLIFKNNNSMWSTPFLLLHLYLAFLYPMYSISTVCNFSSMDTPISSSFSLKYCLALPFSKIKIFSILIISNLYSLTPALISAIWLYFYPDVGRSLIQPGMYNFIVGQIHDHFFWVVLGIIFIYLFVCLFQISTIIGVSRKLFYKGSHSNKLFFFKWYMEIFSVFGITIPVGFISFYSNTIVPFVVMLGVLSVVYYWRTFRLFIDESLSYWKAKRDLLSIAITVLTAAAVFFVCTRNPISFEWNDHYANGDDIFSDIMDKDWKSVNGYFKNHTDLSIVNKSGVGLIHLLAQSDFGQIDNFASLLFQNPALLSMRIKTNEAKCIGSRYCEGVTPIHLLVLNKSSDVIELAIDLLPNSLELKTKFNQTPLHFAAENCAYLGMKTLLERGANPNALDTNGETPLMIAAKKSCVLPAFLLLRTNVNTTLKNKVGKSALDFAKENKNKELDFLLNVVGPLK